MLEQTLTLESGIAVEILQRLILANPRYRQLVNSFSALASLESECTFLEGLKAEAEKWLSEQLRAERAEELRAAQAESQRSQVGGSRDSSFEHSRSLNGKASGHRRSRDA